MKAATKRALAAEAALAAANEEAERAIAAAVAEAEAKAVVAAAVAEVQADRAVAAAVAEVEADADAEAVAADAASQRSLDQALSRSSEANAVAAAHTAAAARRRRRRRRQKRRSLNPAIAYRLCRRSYWPSHRKRLQLATRSFLLATVAPLRQR